MDDSDAHQMEHLVDWLDELMIARFTEEERQYLLALRKLYSNEGWGDVWRVAPIMACKLPHVDWPELLAWLKELPEG